MNSIKKIVFIFSISSALFGIQAMGQTPHFNKKRAFTFLEEQCRFGPRNPGSTGHQQCLVYLTNELKKMTAAVELQEFFYTLPREKKSVRGTNIIARFNSVIKERVVLCAHWDTRPWADMDQERGNHKKPVLGANDGASGVAVLLEIAQHLKIKPPRYGIELVFFDAEDAGLNGSDAGWALGSKEYARQLALKKLPRFGILLDMIGDKNLEIYKEINSLQNVPQLVTYIWELAAELGIHEFNSAPGYQVTDDHLSLLAIGVPCIDIIDFDYPQWHTTHDTPEHCAPESLAKVGQVILEAIYRGDF